MREIRQESASFLKKRTGPPGGKQLSLVLTVRVASPVNHVMARLDRAIHAFAAAPHAT
jgi:hypothetical protein